MRRALNYLGQLRIYSLVDLILMLRAVSQFSKPFLGAVFLWIGFLAFLESIHKDKGREPVNQTFAWLVWLQACIFLGDSSEIIPLYIVFSILYSFKKRWYWARLSPLLRGLQTIAIVVLVSPSEIKWYWLAATALLIAIRNFWGDARDIVQDEKEGIKTWPIYFEMQQRPLAHLFCTLGTTAAWWAYAGDLSLKWLLLVWVVEASTYLLTPRQSNNKTAQGLSKILHIVWR